MELCGIRTVGRVTDVLEMTGGGAHMLSRVQALGNEVPTWEWVIVRVG